MICLDNIIFSLQSAGGVSVYWTELLERMTRSDEDWCVLERSDIENNIQRQGVYIPQRNIIPGSKLPLLLARYLAISTKFDKGTLLHSSYYRYSSNPEVKNIITVYDLTYEKMVSGIIGHVHRLQKTHAIQNAEGIICISKNTRDDLLHYYPEAREKKVTVIPLAASSDYHPVKDKTATLPAGVSTSAPYVLFVGERGRYKNFSLAVEAVAAVENYQLVIVGGGKLAKDERAMLEKQLAGRYILTGWLTSQELNSLYNNAHCLLYPSAYEGFGVPLLEAMQAGCPVIASRVSSIPEVTGDAALLADESNSTSYTTLIKSLEDSTLRDDITWDGIHKAGEFSWDRCYAQTMDFYSDIASSSRDM